ncbi:PAS domain S-box-containing protein [Nocardioides scoriae]|uniref:PAS domain S-box-containing protein n=1 Tax=Nocardioides scoriae TaxID=642780 RepID=A0A1H1NXA0_9ACTN|nr:PAS domain S-box protein [Nocardioides scoriae]SDS03573.1 PAS domain S-box-containing protein [Nocardioides scoriae]
MSLGLAHVRGLRVLIAVVAAIGAVYAVSTVPGVRSRPGFRVEVDGFLQGAGYALMSAALVWRAATVREGRWLWGLVAAAVTARTLGFVVFWTFVRTAVPQPYPSAADALFVGSALLFLAALVVRGARRRRALPRLLLLDGAVAALGVGGVTVAVVDMAVRPLGAPGTPPHAVAVNLAYPVLDVAMLAVVAAMVAAGLRARPADLLLLAGVVLSAVVDVTYLVMLAAGVWRPGNPVGALLYLATALVVLAAWTVPEPAAGPAEPERSAVTRSITAPGLAWTAVLATVCLVGLVVLTPFDHPSAPGVALLGLGIVVAMVRTLQTLRDGQRESDDQVSFSAEERERFVALVEASDDFIAIADLDGRLLYLNPAGRTMTGLGSDDDVRRLDHRSFRPDHVLAGGGPAAMEQLRAVGHQEWSTWLRHQDGGDDVPVLSHSFVMRSPVTGEPLALGSIQRDVTDLTQAREDLRRLAETRQVLLTRLVEAQEDERSRIAADVHDDSVQALAAVQLRLSLLERQLGDSLDDAQRRDLGRMHESLAGATARLRHLLFDLESPARRTDLVTALREAAAYVLDGTGIAWSVVGDPDSGLSDGARVTAYRVAKEALVNTRRHSGAASVAVEVAREDHGVRVSVLDDGRGLRAADLERRPGHLGLASMHDRAVVAGGRLDVGPGPHGGTLLEVWLPTVPAEARVAD